MDQRTRERMPVLPRLTAVVAAAASDAAERLAAAWLATPGQEFTAAGQTLRRAVLTTSSARAWAEEPTTGQRRNLTLEDHRAFWAWATVEVLRHAGSGLENSESCRTTAWSSTGYPGPAS